MVRYDRIARIDSPGREETFPGWLVLRDLEGREREPELGRRARLRFLALRPVRRLLDRGFDQADASSLAQQVQSVRTALGQLPSSDAERLRIAEYLHAIDEGAPDGLATASLVMGEAAEAAGHGYAAEEFYHTALELSVASDLAEQRVKALTSLGHLYAGRAEWGRSQEYLDHAMERAEATGDLVAWARALGGLATLRLLQNDILGAHAQLDRIRERGEREAAPRLIALADAGTCAVELAAGSPGAAVDAGWRALETLDPSDEDRAPLLMDLASAFRRLGLRPAAEACYRLVTWSSGSSAHRLEARVQHALAAAEAGDSTTFRERRQALLAPGEADGDHRLAAITHLGLGRGAMLINDVDDARAHLHTAIDVARAGGLGEAVVLAEDLLSGLEGWDDSELRPHPIAPSAGARTIAARIESMGQGVAATV
jgi:hypothetical protein